MKKYVHLKCTLGCTRRGRSNCSDLIVSEKYKRFALKNTIKVQVEVVQMLMRTQAVQKSAFFIMKSCQNRRLNHNEKRRFLEYLSSRRHLNSFYSIVLVVLWCKMLIFLPIRSNMSSTAAPVARNRVYFLSVHIFSLRGQYPALSEPVSQIST